MYRLWLKKHLHSGRALLLLGVYLLHFVLFQTAVIGFSDCHQGVIKSFFSGPKKETNPNSGIATFRILEKHKSPQKTFMLLPDFPVPLYRFSNIIWVLNGSPSDLAYNYSSIHFSDTSCRLYLRDCIFRI
jgi:hypothetical protein